MTDRGYLRCALLATLLFGLPPSSHAATRPAELVPVQPKLWVVGDPGRWTFDWEYREFARLLSRTRLPDAAAAVITHSPNEVQLLGRMYRAAGSYSMGRLPIEQILPLVEGSTPSRPFTLIGCNGFNCARALVAQTGKPVFAVSGIIEPAEVGPNNTITTAAKGPTHAGLFFQRWTAADGRTWTLREDYVPFSSQAAWNVVETGHVGGSVGGWGDVVNSLREPLDHYRGRIRLPIAEIAYDGGVGPGDMLLFLEHDETGNPLCFAAGTLVATAGGPRPIERIRPGERVWAYEPRTKTAELRQVVQALARPPGRIQRVRIATPQAIESLRTTAEHPFYVPALGWVRAAHLRPGMALVTRSGIRAVVVDSAATSDVEPVFNLEVDGVHSYFAGATEVVVHNGPCPMEGGPRSTATRAFSWRTRVPGGVTSALGWGAGAALAAGEIALAYRHGGAAEAWSTAGKLTVGAGALTLASAAIPALASPWLWIPLAALGAADLIDRAVSGSDSSVLENAAFVLYGKLHPEQWAAPAGPPDLTDYYD